MVRGTRGKVGNGVKVGDGVKLGGIGVSVAVGIAAWVRVMASQACATAVFFMSSALRVGVGAGPQAATVRMIRQDIKDGNFLVILFSMDPIFTIKDKKAFFVQDKPARRSGSEISRSVRTNPNNTDPSGRYPAITCATPSGCTLPSSSRRSHR